MFNVSISIAEHQSDKTFLLYLILYYSYLYIYSCFFVQLSFIILKIIKKTIDFSDDTVYA